MAVGYIYILSNPTIQNLLKIGFTCGNVEERALELRSTGVAEPFEIEYFGLSEDVEEVEKIIHLKLVALRNSANREFFRISLDDAVATVTQSIRRPKESFRKIASRLEKPLDVQRECRRCGFLYAANDTRLCPSCGF